MSAIHKTRVGAMVVATMLATACHHAKPDPDAPGPAAQRLAAIAGQPLMVTPVQSFKSTISGFNAREWMTTARALLDSALTDTLKQRVANSDWVFASALMTSFKQNPTYAADPRALAVQPLRAKLTVGDRLPEPLASQLRTMIALHEGRLVLLPLELRVEPTTPGRERPTLQVVLVDPRSSVIRWFGDVVGPEAATFGADFAAPLASRVADLFVGK